MVKRALDGGPLGDAQLERDQSTHENLRGLDTRAGEDQPTTA
jgi:hypothetical protein